MDMCYEYPVFILNLRVVHVFVIDCAEPWEIVGVDIYPPFRCICTLGNVVTFIQGLFN